MIPEEDLKKKDPTEQIEPPVSQLSVLKRLSDEDLHRPFELDPLETTPLLQPSRTSTWDPRSPITQDRPVVLDLHQTVSRQSKGWSSSISSVATTSLFAIPAVLLALLLNLLDAMSYGIIIFPASSDIIPETAPQSGISMFLVRYLSRFPRMTNEIVLLFHKLSTLLVDLDSKEL